MEKLIRILAISMVAATWVILSHGESFRSHFWLMVLCAVVSTGFLGGVLGLIARRHNGTTPSTHEQIVALKEVKRRHPTAVVTLIILMFWAIVIRGETFGSIRSHVWLVVLGLVASVGFWWAVPVLIGRWWHNGAT